MDSFDLIDGLEVGLTVIVLDHLFGLSLFEFHQNGLVLEHFISGEESANKSTAGIENLCDKGMPR
jgi:hypothetical protein